MYTIYKDQNNEVIKKKDVTITPIQSDSIITFNVRVVFEGNFKLPPNLFLLNINSNVGSFQNIQLNYSTNDADGNQVFSGTFVINARDSSVLKQPHLVNKPIYFVPSVVLNTDIWNNTKFDPSVTEDTMNLFIQQVYSDSNIVFNQVFKYTNLFRLQEFFNSTSLNEQINKPTLSIKGFRNLNFNQWSVIDEIFMRTNNQNLPLNADDYYIEIKYYIDGDEKSFKFNSEKLKNPFNIDYDFVKKELITQKNPYIWNSKIYFPEPVSGEIFIWFKIDESEFYGSNKFSISQPLFGKNGKYKLSYKSDIKYEK